MWIPLLTLRLNGRNFPSFYWWRSNREKRRMRWRGEKKENVINGKKIFIERWLNSRERDHERQQIINTLMVENYRIIDLLRPAAIQHFINCTLFLSHLDFRNNSKTGVILIRLRAQANSFLLVRSLTLGGFKTMIKDFVTQNILFVKCSLNMIERNTKL